MAARAGGVGAAALGPLACAGPQAPRSAAPVTLGRPIAVVPAPAGLSRRGDPLRIVVGRVTLVLETLSSTTAMTDAWPAVRVGGTLSVLDLRGDPPGTSTESWVAAQALSDGHTVVAVLDNVVESPGSAVRIVASGDGGSHWVERSTLEKPHYLATVAAFDTIDAAHFRLTVELADCADCGVPRGRYVYETRDAAATWSPARN